MLAFSRGQGEEGFHVTGVLVYGGIRQRDVLVAHVPCGSRAFAGRCCLDYHSQPIAQAMVTMDLFVSCSRDPRSLIFM